MKRVLAFLLLLSCSANAQILAPEIQRQTDLSPNGIARQCLLYSLSAASTYGSSLINPTLSQDVMINAMTPKLIEAFHADQRFASFSPEIFGRIIQAGVIQGALLAGDETITGPIRENPIRSQSLFIGNTLNEECVKDLEQFIKPREGITA